MIRWRDYIWKKILKAASSVLKGDYTLRRLLIFAGTRSSVPLALPFLYLRKKNTIGTLPKTSIRDYRRRFNVDSLISLPYFSYLPLPTHPPYTPEYAFHFTHPPTLRSYILFGPSLWVNDTWSLGSLLRAGLFSTGSMTVSSTIEWIAIEIWIFDEGHHMELLEIGRDCLKLDRTAISPQELLIILCGGFAYCTSLLRQKPQISQ